MRIEVVEETIDGLASHGLTSSAFIVERILEIDESSYRLRFNERRLDAPYVKDYDEAEPPAAWAARFDVSQWGLLGALVDGRRAGGAAIAFNTPGLEVMEGRTDVAVLWDIRVDPALRRCGIGAALFRAAEDWSASHGCGEIVIETQNTNVPACRFYERHGCSLRAVNPDAYQARPDELQMIWTKRPAFL